MPISLGPQIHGNQEQCLSSHGSAKSSSRLPKPTARSTSNANKSRPSTHEPRAMSLVTRQRKVIKSLAQPRPTTPEEQEQYQSVSALIPMDQEQCPLVPRQRKVIKSLARPRQPPLRSKSSTNQSLPSYQRTKSNGLSSHGSATSSSRSPNTEEQEPCQ